jgi:hypothetical protein
MNEIALPRSVPKSLLPVPLTDGQIDAGGIDDQVLAFPAKRPPRLWYVALSITVTILALGASLLLYTVYTGIGVWGNTSPVFWAFDIINFVFWVGIGHAGTLISACGT